MMNQDWTNPTADRLGRALRDEVRGQGKRSLSDFGKAGARGGRAPPSVCRGCSGIAARAVRAGFRADRHGQLFCGDEREFVCELSPCQRRSSELKSPEPRQRRKPEIIGWREDIALPDLGIARLPAKIDTGARTSALHAVDQTVIDIDGVHWAEFTIPVQNRRTSRRVRAPLIDERKIKNTSGIPELRLVVRTALLLGRHRWQIEVSLANREKMEFDLILGRTAIRKRGILVDPGQSFVLGPPTPAKKAAVKTSTFSGLVRHMKGREQ